ncbi:hypothetical protein PFICI_03336 [Pestalotiopsis fici W106-1]|uniref:Uncharacterized protein n=1 Tax=Pestalotiopsis fici (strain W106-1 / CGMCC3.15140) TaxID=1229662 RepID=W3XJC7_PESFW|nr:uncharacterized protein PFICI_03336 [Pestalotiopsis fici W106-1]ETS85311.1 hypothetical protein PFICI_03336 [Pestalotiopsis fici W106-1]
MTAISDLAVRPAEGPNTFQCTLPTCRGDYLIQISWPLSWKSSRGPENSSPDTHVPILYVLDGNAYFFTATDVARRLEFVFRKEIIIVGIGYPTSHAIYDKRRLSDFTPSSSKPSKPPLGRDGQPLEGVEYGGAEQFLKALLTEIAPYVEDNIFQGLKFNRHSRYLFGHSFGGLFTLYSLFTRPDFFGAHLAASPSIWFQDCEIVHKQEKDFLSKDVIGRTMTQDSWSVEELQTQPADLRLIMTFGSLEENPEKRHNEASEDYQRRLVLSQAKGMRRNTLAMANRLRASGKFRDVSVGELAGEDHGSAAIETRTLAWRMYICSH